MKEPWKSGKDRKPSFNAPAKRSLSQNFLVDKEVPLRILEQAKIADGDFVLEIGPGKGALTNLLLKKGAKLFVIEKDDDLARHWLSLSSLTAFHADALFFPYEEIFSACGKAGLKLVANLPYQITTPLLRRLFSLPFSSITVMIQKEAATRLLAPPHSRLRSPLSVWGEAYGAALSHFSVPPSAFEPRPNVESTVVTLSARTPGFPLPLEPFFAFVEKGFSQRRKMLRSLWGREAVEKAGICPEARAEDLTLDEWKRAYHIPSHRLI